MIGKKEFKISFGYTPYLSRGGTFFFFNPETNKATNNETCREIFESRMNHNKNEWFLFHGKCLNTKNLNKFFEYIENRLNLKEKTEIYYTDCVYAAVIKPSSFWLKNTVNRGFFTLFLRCGGGYYKEDFNKSINSYSLARQISLAINRFLNGFSKINCQISSGNMVNTFYRMSKNQLYKTLVKEKLSNDYTDYMVNISALKNA